MKNSPEQFAAQGRQRREPKRWGLSLLVATVAGVVAMLLSIPVYVAGIMILGVDQRIPEGVGTWVAVSVGMAVAILAWRGIRHRWHAVPPGGETRWGPPTGR